MTHHHPGSLSGARARGRYPGRHPAGWHPVAGTSPLPAPVLAGFCALAAMLAGLLLLMPVQHLTGDEPRYLLYALSAIRHGRFVMGPAEWNRLALGTAGLVRPGLPAGGQDSVLMNGVYLPVLLSPVAGLFSLAGLRLASLLAGTCGLFFLLRLACRVSPPPVALGTVALAALSIPLLPYLHLFYMESFVFALVCWGWDRLQRTGRGFGGDLATAAILLLVPFAHMRGSGVAGCLFLLLLRQAWRRGLHRRAVLLCGLGLGLGLGFVLLNLLIYGAVTGPVNTARPPTPLDWFPVLSMQLFNVHHGLLAYAPVWALGYAGLWAGVRRGPPVLRQALALGAVAALTGVGANPGECWPARFWVLSVPMLAVGLGAWMSRARGPAAFACLAILLAATLLNSALFAAQPNLFLENRQTSMTYDALHWRFGGLDPGLFLPAETGEPADQAAAAGLALTAGLFVALSALALRRRTAAWPALLILLAGLDLSRVERLPRPAAAASMAGGRLHVVLADRPRAMTLQMGHREQTWFTGPAWPRLQVTLTGRLGRRSDSVAAIQVLNLSCNSGIETVDVAARGLALPPVASYPLTLYGSRSLLRMLAGGGRC